MLSPPCAQPSKGYPQTEYQSRNLEMSKKPMTSGNQAPLWEEPEDKSGKAPLPPWSEVGRDQILGRYWELANLDPVVTKGNITGQLKALDSIYEEVALAPAVKHEGVRTLDVYRAGWMGGS
jgi:hypothetical protein